MTHTYKVTGMTCSSCEAKVKTALLSLPEVTSAEVNKERNEAVIVMTKHISISELQNAIGRDRKYKITAIDHSEVTEQAKSWFETYKPILIIFAYITIVTLLIQVGNEHFMPMQWMQHFMAGFFLTFSFFKLLDIKGFAESYAMYDIVAKRIKAWGFIYVFIELALGSAYVINFNLLFTNIITLVIMGLSIIGVLQSVMRSQKIQCACLGSVFNLPMSTVTIIEDVLMIGMSGIMIYLIKFN